MRTPLLAALVLGAMLWACGSSDGGGQDGTCTPGLKGTGEPCTQASECASCECEDVDEATGGQFRVCTTKCSTHAECAPEEVCLYPTVRACVLKCTSAAECPAPYTACDRPTGTYKFCLVQ